MHILVVFCLFLHVTCVHGSGKARGPLSNAVQKHPAGGEQWSSLEMVVNRGQLPFVLALPGYHGGDTKPA